MKRVTALLLILLIVLPSCKLKEDENGSPANPIEPEEITLAVIKPVAGDTLKVASSFEIKWTSNSTSNLRIDYTSDNAGKWNTIVNSVQNTGSYIWSPVPNTISNLCRVRVMTVDSAVGALSEGLFSIVESDTKALVLTAPNGGDVIFSGTDYLIKWVSSGVNNVKLEFSTDGGAVWNVIAASVVADSGKYLWQSIPNLTSETCLVRVSDALDGSLFDTSNQAFTITPAQVVKVTSPNGGEAWDGNSTQTITWFSSDISDVKIEYTTNNGMNWTAIVENTPSDGYFTWDPVPNVAATNCKIRISDASDTFPVDESDNVFAILPEPSLSVVSPNGGENILSGSSIYIRWSNQSGGGEERVAKRKKAGSESQEFSSRSLRGTLNSRTQNMSNEPLSVESVKIELTTDGGSTWSLLVEAAPNNGKYLWNPVPSLNSSLCMVRISDNSDGVPYDLSDASFTIYNELNQELIVTSPDGGEIWEAGTTQEITWNSLGVASVKIEYTTNNGLNWNTIVENTLSDGFYTWTQVPNTASTNCKIRVSDATDNVPIDESNTVFTIAPEPEITVLTPNGGEKWLANGNGSIRWTSTNIENVKIEYSTNSGAIWNVITQSTPSVGTFNWSQIPNVSSQQCRIRISDADDLSPSDISDSNFTITNQVSQSISVTKPNGGEEWEAGTFQYITWDANAINEVKIEYTTNNGITWVQLESNVPSTGSYGWNPLPEVNSTQCKIRLSDAADGDPADESDEVFTIEPAPSLSVVSPNGGEVFVAGDPISIRWNSTGVENVKIEYTVNNGLLPEDWFLLTSNTPSDGLYETGFSIPSAEYRIRISDSQTGSPMDESDGIFTVIPAIQKSVMVVSPNGGENWLGGTTVEVRWVSTNLEKVKIEYTTNGGSEWFVITDSTVSNGIYNWGPIPNHNSDVCKVRISDPYDENTMDLSNNYFSIHPEDPHLRWMFPNGGEYIYRDYSSTPPRLDTLITWISTGVDFVRIEYTDDNGQNWYPIVDNYPSTGAYLWLIPDGFPSTLARIRIYDASDPSITDMSDSYFYLRIAPGINFKSIKGNEVWAKRSLQSISWTATEEVSSINLDYSDDGGKTWKSIARNLANNPNRENKYKWSVPEDIVASNILLRLSGQGYVKITRPIYIIN